MMIMGLIPLISLYSQVVYEPVTNNSVYDLLDELAALKVISINSVAKPYSRIYITGKLNEAKNILADTAVRGVSTRVREAVEFYMRDYATELLITNNEIRSVNTNSVLHNQIVGYDPVGYKYLGKALNLEIRPALGGRFLVNENGNVWEATGGGEVFGYLGKHIGYYVNVKQTWESEPLVKPRYFTMEEGKMWNDLKNGSVSNTEWQAGLSVAWNWGDIGVYKDRPVWGNAQHGANILSGHAPSFPFIQLHLKPAKWFEFRYIAGVLQSIYLDSIYQGGKITASNRVRKYFIGNIITVIPWKNLQISIGNSVIYSEKVINPAFFIPFFFYKSVDQSQSNLSVDNGQNNQFFFDIHYRAFRYFSLYCSVFIDDLKMEAFWKEGQHNEISSKIGFQLSGWPLKNLTLAGEYTRTNPLTYQHYVTSIDYYSAGYCLGSYLRDNSEELFFRLDFRPSPRVTLSCEYQFIRHGQDFLNIRYLDNYILPVLDDISSRVTAAGINLDYLLYNRFMLTGGFLFKNSRGDVKYNPLIFHGNTYSVFVGFQIGF